MPIDSKECFTSLTTDGQLYEIYLAAQANGGGGGGAFGAVYYFNRSNASSISGYYEMSKNLVIGAGTTLTATGSGTQLVGSFATVLNDPNVTTIPSGNWNFENYVSISSNGGTPKIYGEIYKRNLAGTETLIATNISNPHPITDGTVNELYLWSIPVPATIILATDRIVVKFYALDLGGRTMTMHFENSNVAQTTTSLPSVDLSAYVLKAGDTMTGILDFPSGGLKLTVLGDPELPNVDINSGGLTLYNGAGLFFGGVGDATARTNLRTQIGAEPTITTLPIAKGGTGSTTAANALTALGAVAKAGDTMTGKLNLPASTTASAGLNLGVGAIPTSPVVGDLIATNSRLYFQESPTTQRIIAYTNSSNNFNNIQSIDANTTTTLLRVTQRGPGEAFRVEDESPDTTPFVISASGRVGIGVTPDATVALSVDTTGIKFNDGTIQTTAATGSGTVTSVTATSPITSTGGATPIISTSMATNRLLGRSTAGTGVAEEISIGTGLSLAAGTLSNTGVLGVPTDASYVKTIRTLTSTEYDALGSIDPNTIYFII